MAKKYLKKNNNSSNNELFFNSIVRNIPDMVFVKDAKNLKFEFLNTAGEKLLGHKIKQIIGKSDYDFFPKKQADFFIKKDREVLKNKKLIDISEEPIKTPSGIRYLHTKKIPILDNKGKSRFLLGISDDITEKKILEDKIKEYAEEKFKIIFDHSKDGIIIMDLKNMKFSLINNAMCKMTGYKLRELNKMTVRDLHPKKSLPYIMDQLDKQIKGKIEIAKDILIERKDGSTFFSDVNASIIKINNQKYILGLFRDISERKISESNQEKVNRSLRVISAINQSLIYVTSESILLNQACKIAVDIGGYNLAWVGYLENDKNKTINPVAQAGLGSEYVKKTSLTWSNTIRGRGPGGTAVRTGKVQIIHDILTDPSMKPWRKDALKKGYKSVVGLPLKNKEKVFGVILIYSKEVNAFCDDEIKILNELASDLSFGIITYRKNEDTIKLKKAVETSGEAIYMTDSDGIITFANLEFTNLYGYKNVDVVGKVTPRILKSGQRTKDDYAKFWNDLKMGKSIKDEHVNKTKDGRLLMVASLTNPIFNDKNNIIGFLSIQRDITKSKQIEDALKESEEKYRELVENSPDAIIVYIDGIIVFVNKECISLMRASKKEDILGKSVMQFVHPDSRAIVIERMNRSIKEKINLPAMEEKFIRMDGSVVETEVKSMPIKFNNKLATQVIMRDITERKNLDIAKVGFLSVASHQLRTPLSMTKWVLEALLREDGFTDSQKNKLNDLVYSNERLINLVEDLLNVSMIETGKLVVNKKIINLVELINNLVISLKSLSNKKNKIIKIIISPNVKDVYCDPILINESLENLLTNAIVYSKEDSKEVIITVENRNKDYLISVHNEGYIDDLSAEKINIFDKFSRGLKSQEIEPSGSGLGLYITKKMVEAGGGTIWFTSNIKSGTTFYITIVKSKLKE